MTIDWAVVRAGVTPGVVLVAVAVISSAALSGVGGESSPDWRLPLFALLTVGAFAAAGLNAGRSRPATPLLHGGLSALLVFVAALIVGLGLAAVRDQPVSWPAVPAAGLVAVTIGAAGALAGDRFSAPGRAGSVVGPGESTG